MYSRINFIFFYLLFHFAMLDTIVIILIFISVIVDVIVVWSNCRIPVYHCILEGASFEEWGITFHMQISGRYSVRSNNIIPVILIYHSGYMVSQTTAQKNYNNAQHVWQQRSFKRRTFGSRWMWWIPAIRWSREISTSRPCIWRRDGLCMHTRHTVNQL